MSERETKTFDQVEMKDGGEDSREFSATFSTFGAIDKDLDVTLPGAFDIGAQVIVGAYNHSSVKSDALPVGIGVLQADAGRAWIKAEFLNTPAGRTYHQTLKALGPLCEWSFTYEVKDASTDYAELKNWPGARRILKSLAVLEVAPVIRGAGVNTRTDWVKNDDLLYLDEEFRPFVNSDEEVNAIWEQMQGARADTRVRDLADLRFI